VRQRGDNGGGSARGWFGGGHPASLLDPAVKVRVPNYSPGSGIGRFDPVCPPPTAGLQECRNRTQEGVTMRLQQLALRVSGDGQKLRFHERLTVISGISVEDRQGVVEVILGTLAGEPTVSSELAYVGRSGQRITVDQTAEGTFHTFHDDGTPAPPPSTHLG